MRKYYLFIINSKYYNVYNDNPDLLYKALNILVNTSVNTYSFGFSIHNQLCETIDVDLLSHYFNERFNIKNNKYTYLIENNTLNELSIVILKKSCIRVFTNSNLPSFFRVFKLYNKRIFVVDFENKDYFWLNQYYRKYL